MIRATIGLVCLLAAGCGSSQEEAVAEGGAAFVASYEAHTDEPEAAREAGVEDAAADLAASTYQDEFGSSECTEDCSGHDAGYEWAANKGITDPYECSGNSTSFIEGCEAYAEEVQERADEAAEEGSEVE
jgi:hypothetical protein